MASNPEMPVSLGMVQVKVFLERLKDAKHISVVVFRVGKAPEIAGHGIPVREELKVLDHQIRQIDGAKALLLDESEPSE
jgi:hypothetical protein